MVLAALVDEGKRAMVLMHRAEYLATRRWVTIHIEECWPSGMRSWHFSSNCKENFGRSRAIRNQRMYFSRQEADWVREQQRYNPFG